MRAILYGFLTRVVGLRIRVFGLGEYEEFDNLEMNF